MDQSERLLNSASVAGYANKKFPEGSVKNLRLSVIIELRRAFK